MYKDKNVEKAKHAEWRAKNPGYYAAYYAKNKQHSQEANKAWRAAHLDKIAAANKQNWEKNREQLAASNKKYQESNKKKIAAQQKEYRERNKDAIAAKRAKYREEHRAHAVAKTRAWYTENKDSDKFKAARNARDKRIAVSGMDEDEKWMLQEAYALAKLREKVCGGKWEVDHVVPLSKGGLHSPYNVQVVPAAWNRSKHASHSRRMFGAQE